MIMKTVLINNIFKEILQIRKVYVSKVQDTEVNKTNEIQITSMKRLFLMCSCIVYSISNINS